MCRPWTRLAPVPPQGDEKRTGTSPKRFARVRDGGLVEAIAVAQKGVAVGVEARDRSIHAVHRVVVATLAVFGLVVDRAVLDLHLADAQVALVVGLVVLGVPQVELEEREQGEALGRLGGVGQGHLVDLRVDVHGHEEQHRRAQAAARSRDARVAHAVARLERVEVLLVRAVQGAPHVAAIVNREDPPAIVDRSVVVPVAREPTHLGVTVEAVAAAGVRDEPEELLGPQVIDPGVRRVRRLYDVLTGFVVEVAELHVETFRALVRPCGGAG